MNSRKAILLIVALVIAGVTMKLARSSMTPAVQTPNGETVAVVAPKVVEVLVAARDLPAGTLLKDADMKWQPWPKDGATDLYAVKGQKEVKDFSGAVVRQGIRSGEPLMTTRIVRSSEQGFLAAVLTPGMRAVSIPITPASGVAGFIFPGDRVDVIVAHKTMRRAPDGSGMAEHKVSETMLSDVRVLALDQKTDDQAREVKVAQLATLEVNQAQAERLALVNELGTLSLALRSLASDAPTDKGIDISSPVSAKLGPSGSYTLDSDVSLAVPQPANRNGRVQRVQIMRGKDMTETVFDAQ